MKAQLVFLLPKIPLHCIVMFSGAVGIFAYYINVLICINAEIWKPSQLENNR